MLDLLADILVIVIVVSVVDSKLPDLNGPGIHNYGQKQHVSKTCSQQRCRLWHSSCNLTMLDKKLQMVRSSIDVAVSTTTDHEEFFP